MGEESFWHRVDDVFDRALEVPEPERDSFLSQACGEDDVLRREVEALLSVDAEACSFLDRPFVRLTVPPEGADEPPPKRLGPYRILRPLDEGGMGAVYLAAREDDEFDRLVAVKLVRRGFAGPHVHERFQRERRIHARLEHPAIARLYDAGTTAEGRAYLVMELVRGEPIDRYCDRHGLGVRPRLELFLQACEAVTYAHRNLVVHRDLKPANLLVTEDGEAKLLDFGIAKLLAREGPEDDPGSPLANDPTVTRTGELPLTPLYASPEQVRGEAVSTASDVYSLGVLLYRLLTGRSPYRNAGPGRRGIEKAVLEEEPERASEAVSRPVEGGPSPEEVARTHGGLSPSELRRRLSGDLDVLLTKALQKEPERRYGSVQEMAEDVRRYLDDRPLLARPDSRLYRARKLVRRHRLAVVFTVALLAGAAVFAVSLGAAHERTTLQRDRAEKVSDFLVGLFQQADPNRSRGEDLTARQLLDQGLEKLDDEGLSDQPLLRGTLLQTIGNAYVALGDQDRAKPLLAEAVDLFRQADQGSQELISALADLAHIQSWTFEHEQARGNMEEALALARELYGPNDPRLLPYLRGLPPIYFELGDHEASERVAREAVAVARANAAESPRALATALYTLADDILTKGKIQEGRDLLEEAVELAREHYGEDHPRHMVILRRFGDAQIANGELAAGRESLERAVALMRRVYHEPHPDLAFALQGLAGASTAEGKLRTALEQLEESEEHFRATLGGSHPFLGMVLRDRAAIHLTLGDEESAVADARDAGEIFHGVDPAHPMNAEMLRLQAEAARRRGRYEEARKLLAEGLEINRAYSGNLGLVLALQLLSQAELALDEGRLADARTALDEVQETNDGADAQEGLRLSEARLLAAEGQWQQAEEGLRALRAQAPPGTEGGAGGAEDSAPKALVHLAALLLERGEAGEAGEIAREALTWAKENLGENGPPYTAQAKLALGASLVRQGRSREARPLLEEAQAVLGEGQDGLPIGEVTATSLLAELSTVP